MKKILATTALISLMAGSTFAATNTGNSANTGTNVEIFYQVKTNQSGMSAQEFLASKLIGSNVYTPKQNQNQQGNNQNQQQNQKQGQNLKPPAPSNTGGANANANANANAAANGAGNGTANSGASTAGQQNANANANAKANDPTANWDDIGTISNVIMGQDGKAVAVLVDVGGFLGIGSHTVALDWNALKFVPETKTRNPHDFYVTVMATKTELKKAPAFDQAAWEGQAKGQNANNQQQGNANATANGNAAGTQTAVVTQNQPANQNQQAKQNQQANQNQQAAGNNGQRQINLKGYTRVQTTDLTASELEGAPVYDANNKEIGSVSKLIIAPDKKTIKEAVIDVGGWLGIGAKPVAVPMNELQILSKGKNTKDLRVYLTQTKAQLKQMPTYKSK